MQPLLSAQKANEKNIHQILTWLIPMKSHLLSFDNPEVLLYKYQKPTVNLFHRHQGVSAQDVVLIENEDQTVTSVLPIHSARTVPHKIP